MRRSLCLVLFAHAAFCLFGCGKEEAPAQDMGVDLGAEPDLSRSQDMAQDMAKDMARDVEMDVDASCMGRACLYIPRFAFEDIREVDGLEIPSSFQDRQLPLVVRFPEDTTVPLPVVVWAHAGSWSRNGHKTNEAWSRRIAAAGYAVVHFAVVPPSEELLPEICSRAGLEDASRCDDVSLGNIDTEIDDPADNPFSAITVVRPADGASVIDALPAIAARIEDRSGVKLDTTRVIVAGWSGGSQVSLQMAGARRLAEDSTPPYHDPDERPLAFIALSPQGPGFSNFYAGEEGTSWDDIIRPVMIMTGVGDEKPGNDLTGADRYAVYTHLPPGGKRLFYSTSESNAIKHSTFNLTEFDSPDQDAAAISRALLSSVLAFLDAHAREDDRARAWLESDAAVKISGDTLEWKSK